MTGSPKGQRLVRAAGLLARYPFQGWFYGDSIGFEGLVAAADLFEDERWSELARGFILGWATRARPYREMDNTFAGRALCILSERSGDDRLLQVGQDLAEHLRLRRTIGAGAWISFAKAPLREPYGGGSLPPDEAKLLPSPGPGVYVDCLHFDPPFFVHLGRLLGDAAMVDAGAGQAMAYVSMLQDRDTGLFHHFWLERTGKPYVLGWSRGQGWALLGLLDILDELPTSHASHEPLLRAMLKLARGMLDMQRSNGAWWAVAQLPESGPETSTAAFMAAGLRRGVERSWLDRAAYWPAAEAAWQATLAELDESGALRGVSAAVWSSTSIEHYFHVPRGLTVPWGQGPLLLAAAAWARPG